MKILFSGANGIDSSIGYWYRDVLRRMGHDVTFFGLPNLGTDVGGGISPATGYAPGTHIADLLEITDGPYDIFWYVEQNGLIPLGIENVPFPTICIINDLHAGMAHRRIPLARFFDYVFCQQYNYLDLFSEHPSENVVWLPYACDTEIFYDHKVPRDLDIAFVGQLHTAERMHVIPKLVTKYRMNEQRRYLMSEIPHLYSRARVVINMPLADDLNMRFFEAMSCGALLITRRHNSGQERLFREDEHYVAYSTSQELFEKIDYYLNHEAERAIIAHQGYEEIRRKHRLDLRVQRILEHLQGEPKLVAPIRRISPTERDRLYAWFFEDLRSLEGGLVTMTHARMRGRSWMPLMIPLGRTFLRHLRHPQYQLRQKARHASGS
jgi:glycosyltransferase involved in cell wall biosynthesis